MQETDVFVMADRALLAVVGQIRDAQWDMVMPPEYATSAAPGGDITLREVITRHAYDDAWVPDMLAGRTMAEVGVHQWEGDLLGEDPKAAFASFVDTACAAAQALDDLQRTVHCSFGDYTAQEYLWQINGFRGLRAHDIATVIGADAMLPAELVQGLWEELEPVADEWRTYGVFPARVDVPDHASAQDKLLALTGRQPDTTDEDDRQGRS